MKYLPIQLIRTTTLIGLLAAAGAVQAHTGHGTSGVSEGLAHPLGADHLLAMLAVGIWSVSALPVQKAWWGPAMFMLALIVSAALGAAGLSIPFLEQLISMSVMLFGAMLVLTRVRMSASLGLGLVALAGSLHGLAHGTETPATGFVTFALGFLATTATLHFGGVAAGLGVRKYLAAKANWVMAALGTLCGASGLYLLSQI
jgi:urease accessory protein